MTCSSKSDPGNASSTGWQCRRVERLASPALTHETPARGVSDWLAFADFYLHISHPPRWAKNDNAPVHAARETAHLSYFLANLKYSPARC